MTHITIDTLNHGWNFGFVAERFDALLTALRERSRRRRQFRTVEAELDQYSASEIAELGISRADIAFIAEDATRG